MEGIPREVPASADMAAKRSGFCAGLRTPVRQKQKGKPMSTKSTAERPVRSRPGRIRMEGNWVVLENFIHVCDDLRHAASPAIRDEGGYAVVPTCVFPIRI